jgi:predicted methyltransferase
MKALVRVSILALALAAAGASAAQDSAPPYLAAAVAAPGRPAEDVVRDPLRKPAALMAFAGIKPGDRVADLMPGGGYFTRLFSVAVGAQGHVYTIVPAELAAVAAKAKDAAQTLAANPAYANVTLEVLPTAQIGAPEPLDLVWTSDNYHDLYGFFGADQAAAADAAVFRALKPGGVYIVIDHAARAGSGGADAKTLHRIDPETVKAQVLAAGFKLEAESVLLRNPADSRDAKVFDPSIRGHTDQFIFKFRKPRA